MKEIEGLITNLENDSNNNLVEQKMPVIKQAISELLNCIKNSDDMIVSVPYFELLDKIQFILARHYFRNDIQVPLSLKNFIKDFDRLDDVDMRLHLFNRVKKGEYHLG